MAVITGAEGSVSKTMPTVGVGATLMEDPGVPEPGEAPRAPPGTGLVIPVICPIVLMRMGKRTMI